ncbi:DUF6980 family protein [Sphingomonas sp. Leaf30]|uniref:DUF6980 family protein n=1 Tax=unclassified Sphingomonas TaxID=196159 RepID=UPI003FA76A20
MLRSNGRQFEPGSRRPRGSYGLSRCLRYRNERRLRLHDGGSSAIEIAFCPWCGARLPQMDH